MAINNHYLFNKEFEEIRLLPMSKDEFDTYENVCNWLNSGMHDGEGKYYYKRRNISTNNNILVMFQYNGEVIATAIMIDEEKFNDSVEGYSGIYYFDRDSILVLKEPINKFDIQRIDNTFKNFSQATTRFNKDTYDDFIKLINKKADK